MELNWPALWAQVGDRLAAHRAAGRTHLLTEDTLRHETVLALEGAGVTPNRLAVEVPAPALGGGKLDLVVDPPGAAVIELKYPRHSRTGYSPDTMTLGELLRDFLRVAVVSADERWVVQLLNDRLARYVDATCRRYGLRWAGTVGETVEIAAGPVADLPLTAARAIGAAMVNGTVLASCAVATPVGAGLTLYAYRVNGLLTAGAVPPAAAPPPRREPVPTSAPGAPAPSGGTRDPARREILDAARAVTTRSGRATFSMADVIAEMRRRGTGYAESTIRTMMSAHLCANSTGAGIAGYTDLTRVGHGMYRLTDPR